MVVRCLCELVLKLDHRLTKLLGVDVGLLQGRVLPTNLAGLDVDR